MRRRVKRTRADPIGALVKRVTGPSRPATDLLAELLGLFELHEAREHLGEITKRRARASRRGLPKTHEAYATLHLSELTEARETLESLLSRIAEFRRGCLYEPNAYKDLWRFTVDEWNHAIREQGWRTLPPLCEACGRPVLVRDPVSFACSDVCRHRARSRESGATKRLKERAARKRARRGQGA